MADMTKIHGAIHTASAAAAGVGAGLAQIPGSDSAVLIPIQLAMITAIALAHGQTISKAAAVALLGTFTATIAGRTASQLLIGWIPVVGNVINSATAAGLTEAIGWAAHEYFSDLPDAKK